MRAAEISVPAHFGHDFLVRALLLEFANGVAEVGEQHSESFGRGIHFEQLLFFFGIEISFRSFENVYR